jgi:hypothetical protein
MNIDQPGSQRFYLALAAKDHAAADAGVLANVRDKHLASAATWEGLANLAGRTAAGRDARATLAAQGEPGAFLGGVR